MLMYEPGGQQVTGYRTVEAPRLARHDDCLSLILSRWRYDLAMAKPTYNADGARRYREKRAAHIALLVKSAQRAGILDEINQQADQHTDELRHSRSLEVWRYQPRSKEKAHLYVE